MDFENKHLLVTFVLIAVLIVFAKAFHNFVSKDFEQTISAAPVPKIQSYELEEAYEVEDEEDTYEEEVDEDSDIIMTEELVIDSEGRAVWKEKRYNKWTLQEVPNKPKSEAPEEDLREKISKLEKKVKILEHKRYGNLTEGEL